MLGGALILAMGNARASAARWTALGVALGNMSSAIDKKVIDGVAVNGSAKLVDLGASLLRRTQSGFLYHYAFAMILGLIALMAVLMTYWR